MPKQLTDISITHISLVKAGANGKQFIYKTASTEPEYVHKVVISKKDDEKGIVYGIVYAPDQVDSQGDFAKAEDIEKAAYGFMKSLRGHNIDVDYSFEKEAAFVVESWITKSGDSTFPDEPMGSWAVAIQLETEELRDLAKSGELAAFSMAGSAEKTEVNKADSNGFKNFFQALVDATTGVWVEFGTYLEKSEDKGGIHMDKFAKIVKEKIDKSLAEAQGAATEMQKASDAQTDKIEKLNTSIVVLEKQNKELASKQEELASENKTLKETNEAQERAAQEAKENLEKESKETSKKLEAVTKSLGDVKEAYQEVTEVIKASKQSGDFKKVETVIKDNAKKVM